MRASLVRPNTGRTVCSIHSGHQADSGIVVGRQQQFDIRDPACSRQQARLEFQLTDGQESFTVTCVGAGRLCVESADAAGENHRRVLTMGESAVLSEGDALTLGNECRLEVRITTEQAAKRPRLDDAVNEVVQQDSDEDSDEINRQLNIMRQKAARLSNQSEQSTGSAGQSERSADASQLEASVAVSQSNHSGAVSQLKAANVDSQSNHSEAVSQLKASNVDSQLKQAASSADQLKPTPPGWRDFGTAIVYTTSGCVPSCKIAGFDMDGTLITTQSGRVFPKDIGDWRVIFPQVPGRLKSLVGDGFKVVLFSNQKGVEAGKVKIEDLKVKIERVAARLGAPLQAFLSVRGHRHRKPCSGMWRLLELPEFNSGLRPDPAVSFYVGDAAGRPAETGKGKNGRKADFSCSDRLFALNCRLGAFHTPEEFFLGHRPAPQCRMPEFNPASLIDVANDDGTDWPTIELRQLLLDSKGAGPILVLLVGYPASGKSTLCRLIARLLSAEFAQRAVSTVSRDQLGTWQRCVRAAETALRAADDAVVLVDNTNTDSDSRQRYVECARPCKARIVCLKIECSFAQCLHNERFRRILEEEAADEAKKAGGSPSKKRREPVSEMVFNQMRARYSEPSLAEGFERILSVPFVPSFQQAEHRKLYCEYLMEK